MSAVRYAVYWAPEPDHPLWMAGCRWLGRDPAAADLTPPPRADVSEPWRYGFHATLKAPMRLRSGMHSDAFMQAVQALAARTPNFEMPRLEVAWLSDFLALRPVAAPEPHHALRQLADACVHELDVWRAPLNPAEQARRQADVSLDPAQRALLQRWGYPHVFEHWRFHMTLSNAMPSGDDMRRQLQAEAQAHFGEALHQPLRAQSLCIFEEGGAGRPFALTHRFALACAETC